MKQKKMNIYFISVFPPPYRGVGVWNERILKILENKEELDLTVYSTRQKKFFKANVIAKDIPLLKKVGSIFYTYFCLLIEMLKGNIGFKEYLSTGRFVFNIWSILTQVDAEKKYHLYISHANLFTLMMFYIFDYLKASSKIFLHEHGSGAIEYAALRPKIVEKIFGRADSVIVTTNFMKEVCVNDGCKREKISVVPCGIEFTDKPYLEKDNSILFCGSLEKHKDPISLIRAIPIVLELLESDDILFTLIGEGSLRGQIQEEVDKLGIGKYVKLTGALSNDDVLKYYQTTKLFVLPSVREPFGIVLIEAMSNFTPCIVTNVGGMPEIVDPSFGRIVAERSPEQLAQAIVEIMAKDDAQYKEMCIRAYEAAKKYDMKIIGERFYNLFQVKQLEDK